MLAELFSCATLGLLTSALGSDYSTRSHANAQHMSGTPFQRSNRKEAKQAFRLLSRLEARY